MSSLNRTRVSFPLRAALNQQRSPRLLGVRSASQAAQHSTDDPSLDEVPGGTRIIDPDNWVKSFPAVWLRDHCPCPDCLHPETKQRLLNTFQIPEDISASQVIAEVDGLRVTWNHDAHESYYPHKWLRNNHPYKSTLLKTSKSKAWKYVNPAQPAAFPVADYERIMSSEGSVARWTDLIHRYGFCFISNTPPTPSATESLINRIAFIRPTHYGGFWDFTSQANPTDTAYTTLALPVHTDTTYFTDPCGLQLFHLLSHTEGGGGESTLVDGFKAAEYLYDVDRGAYEVLSSVPIMSHASGDKKVGSIDNSAVEAGFPVLRHKTPHAPGGRATPRGSSGDSAMNNQPRWLSQVRWNNDDRSAATRWASLEEMRRWYDAARKWSEILEMKDLEIQVQLQPGTPLIFDNWRMLHGRLAFTGKRRVCGAYVGMDDFLARWRTLNARTTAWERDVGDKITEEIEEDLKAKMARYREGLRELEDEVDRAQELVRKNVREKAKGDVLELAYATKGSVKTDLERDMLAYLGRKGKWEGE